MTVRRRPISDEVYTTTQIITVLDLLDSPCLLVNLGSDDWQPIQTACESDEDMVAKIGFCKWRYAYTTREWIPVFYSVGNEIYRFIDLKEVEVRNKYIGGGYDQEGMPVPLRCIGTREDGFLVLK